MTIDESNHSILIPKKEYEELLTLAKKNEDIRVIFRLDVYGNIYEKMPCNLIVSIHANWNDVNL